MIPVNELRIGNYVLCEGGIERLAMIDSKRLSVNLDGSFYALTILRYL